MEVIEALMRESPHTSLFALCCVRRCRLNRSVALFRILIGQRRQTPSLKSKEWATAAFQHCTWTIQNPHKTSSLALSLPYQFLLETIVSRLFQRPFSSSHCASNGASAGIDSFLALLNEAWTAAMSVFFVSAAPDICPRSRHDGCLPENNGDLSQYSNPLKHGRGPNSPPEFDTNAENPLKEWHISSSFSVLAQSFSSHKPATEHPCLKNLSRC